MNPVDTGRKLNVHKTFRRRPGHLLNVLCTFNLHPVSTGKGLYNINPSLPKYSFTWDVGIVVKYLNGILKNLKQGLSGKL